VGHPSTDHLNGDHLTGDRLSGQRPAVDALHQLLDLHADLEHHYRATAQLWDRLARRQDRHLLDPRWQDMRSFTTDLDPAGEALDDAEVELLAAWARLAVGLVRGAMLAVSSTVNGVGADRSLVLETASEDVELSRLIRQLGEFDTAEVGGALGKDQAEADYLEDLREAAVEALTDAYRATRTTPGATLPAAAKGNFVAQVTESGESLGDLSNALLILLGRGGATR
jgi:hypothetical protein